MTGKDCGELLRHICTDGSNGHIDKWLAAHPGAESKVSLLEKLPQKHLASKRKNNTAQHHTGVQMQQKKLARKAAVRILTSAACPPPLVPMGSPQALGKQIAQGMPPSQ